MKEGITKSESMAIVTFVEKGKWGANIGAESVLRRLF